MTEHPACAEHPTYRIVATEQGAAIEFLPCGTRSYHRDDIANRWCARCHRFIHQFFDRMDT